jgi:hypothetical protein
MTDAYLNTVLDNQFGAGAVATYYLGLISSTNYTGIDKSTDSMTSHAGWEEFEDVTGVRPTWTPGSVTDQEVTNPTAASFTPDADGEVVGFFVSTNSTVGGTGGSLVDMVLFSEAQEIVSGEPFQVTWTLNARDIGN